MSIVLSVSSVLLNTCKIVRSTWSNFKMSVPYPFGRSPGSNSNPNLSNTNAINKIYPNLPEQESSESKNDATVEFDGAGKKQWYG